MLEFCTILRHVNAAPALDYSRFEPEAPNVRFLELESGLSTVQMLILPAYRLVLETLTPLPGDRKCFRMINGVLTERTVNDVLPALQMNADGLKKVLEDLVKQYRSKQEEMEKWKVCEPGFGVSSISASLSADTNTFDRRRTMCRLCSNEKQQKTRTSEDEPNPVAIQRASRTYVVQTHLQLGCHREAPTVRLLWSICLCAPRLMPSSCDDADANAAPRQGCM